MITGVRGRESMSTYRQLNRTPDDLGTFVFANFLPHAGTVKVKLQLRGKGESGGETFLTRFP